MDAVYILGNGSLANNDEIKYSVRSLSENMLDLENLFIIGENPDNLPLAKVIIADDSYSSKWQNVFNKTRLACQCPDISDEFLLMNDDFFILQPFLGAEYPFYALKNSNGGSDGMNSFHVHAPIRIKKDWYLNMPLDINSKGTHSPRSFYSNFYKAPPTFCSDFIIQTDAHFSSFDSQIQNKPVFSISNSAMLNPDFVSWLDQLYPTPSRFEFSQK